MKIKNTTSGFKHIRFADAFIQVPAKTEWLAINQAGMVYALVKEPFIDFYGKLCNSNCEYIEIANDAVLVACVEDHNGAQILAIDSMKMDAL